MLHSDSIHTYLSYTRVLYNSGCSYTTQAVFFFKEKYRESQPCGYRRRHACYTCMLYTTQAVAPRVEKKKSTESLSRAVTAVDMNRPPKYIRFKKLLERVAMLVRPVAPAQASE